MKLERARQLEHIVKRQTGLLNEAMAEAAKEGLHVSASLTELQVLGLGNTPLVQTEVKVNLDDIEV